MTNITIEKAVLEQVLGALELYLNMDTIDESYLLEVDLAPKAITALRQAMEQTQQKRPPNCGTGYCSCIECVMEQPAQREPVAWVAQKPLRAEAVYWICRRTLPKTVAGLSFVPEWALPLARAIEAAHGIGENT